MKQVEPKMTKTEYLQNICDSLRSDYQYEFVIEFRQGRGWFAVTSEWRYFEDNGEFLGENWEQAEKTLRWLLG